MIRKFFKLTALACVLVFALAQFVRPARTNPPVVQAQTIGAHVRVTPEVEAILGRSCKDCHSHRTEWPWYTQVAPVSWFVVDHVEHGRKDMNFSEWSAYDRERAEFLLGGICMTARRGVMPLASYTWIHRSAKLSPADVQTLCAWSQSEQQRLAKR